MTALGFGYGQAMMFWVFATIFYVGAILVDDGTITFLQFFQAFFAVVLGAFGIGQVRVGLRRVASGRVGSDRIGLFWWWWVMAVAVRSRPVVRFFGMKNLHVTVESAVGPRASEESVFYNERGLAVPPLDCRGICNHIFHKKNIFAKK